MTNILETGRVSGEPATTAEMAADKWRQFNLHKSEEELLACAPVWEQMADYMLHDPEFLAKQHNGSLECISFPVVLKIYRTRGLDGLTGADIVTQLRELMLVNGLHELDLTPETEVIFENFIAQLRPRTRTYQIAFTRKCEAGLGSTTDNATHLAEAYAFAAANGLQVTGAKWAWE